MLSGRLGRIGVEGSHSSKVFGPVGVGGWEAVVWKTVGEGEVVGSSHSRAEMLVRVVEGSGLHIVIEEEGSPGKFAREVVDILEECQLRY